MKKELTVSQDHIEQEESAIYLPIKNKDLGNFISSLLGQEQTIERVLYVKFDIDHAWLINLHHCINQRITQQANAHLVDFKAVIYFETGLKRTIGSIKALETYRETKQLTSLAIKVIWNYLVHFPNKDYPEKQQITFEAFSQSPSQIRKSKKDTSNFVSRISYDFISNLFPFDDLRSVIRYQIDHTERTWGDDIESIIHSEVENIERHVTPTYWLATFIRIIMIPIFILGGVYVHNKIFISRDDIISSKINDFINTISGNVTVQSLNQKVDLLIEFASISSHKNEFISVATIFGTGALIIIFLTATTKKQYSFLNLTEKSNSYRKKLLKRENRSTLIIASSFIFSIVASIIANLISKFMT